MLWVAIRAATPWLRRQVEQALEHRARGGGVEVAGRLVGQQQARLVGQGAGDGDALLLAAGQLGRLVVQRARPGPAGQQLARRGRAACLRLVPAIICGRATLSSAVNSGSRWWNW